MIADRSNPVRTVSRTKWATCPEGTKSWIDGGSSQTWSTSQARNVLLIPRLNHDAPSSSRKIRLLGQAPSDPNGYTTPSKCFVGVAGIPSFATPLNNLDLWSQKGALKSPIIFAEPAGSDSQSGPVLLRHCPQDRRHREMAVRAIDDRCPLL